MEVDKRIIHYNYYVHMYERMNVYICMYAVTTMY